MNLEMADPLGDLETSVGNNAAHTVHAAGFGQWQKCLLTKKGLRLTQE
eukprot:CAMPEP_0172785778 /NCGR_PEP_ID=MMETSP1074-20121228/205616_1 /TAXON_ID=2916 /ORGANISM="Ceratium fusus, Strain PA161109" /LENGTH=47 /DNA_ID= /DNA_START= /DNA_END= /DNA_ORIENTATION=